MEGAAIERVAEEFWESAGNPEPFPRALEASVLWALPLAVLKFPRLWVSDVRAWLAQRQIHYPFDAPERPLHGCLIARGGRGFVLLNGADDQDELRFSLAHETAHFIVDYLRPRQRAERRLGPGILEVFDGLRPATTQERAHAVLSGVAIGFHTHLMGRSSDGALGCSYGAGEAESGADLLALELLAPAKEVRRRVCRSSPLRKERDLTEIASETLRRDFGLPSGIASGFARYLYPTGRSFSVREWLRPADS